MRKYHFDLESIELSEKILQQYDCVLLATDHKKFDYELILKHSHLIVDSSGKYRAAQDRVFKA